jgi:hypothetical protein
LAYIKLNNGTSFGYPVSGRIFPLQYLQAGGEAKIQKLKE